MSLIHSDEYIEALGNYYTYHNILERTGITFERFIHMNSIGSWDAKLYLNH